MLAHAQLASFLLELVALALGREHHGGLVGDEGEVGETGDEGEQVGRRRGGKGCELRQECQ
jgi:hypothetical protein